LYDTSEAEAEEARPTTNRLLDELYRQASPFAERLTEAEEAVEENPEEFVRFEAPVFGEAPATEEPEPAVEDFRIETPRVEEPPPAPAPSAPLADALALRAALVASGVPTTIADTVIEDAERHMQPFDRLEPLSAHVRRALADRIKVK